MKICASSPLLERAVFELRGPNESIAAKIGEGGNGINCMMAGLVMEMGTGKHTSSMQLRREEEKEISIFCGVVSDGAACDQSRASAESI